MDSFGNWLTQNVGLNSQFTDERFKRSAQTENILFSIRSATKQALQWILSYFCPSESLSPRRVRLKSGNSNTVMRMGQHQGGGGGFRGCGRGAQGSVALMVALSRMVMPRYQLQ